jgi:hypothetical protein
MILLKKRFVMIILFHNIQIIFSLDELLTFLEKETGVDYIIYLDNTVTESKVRKVAIQYTTDGKMILIITIVGNYPYSNNDISLFKEFHGYLGSLASCISTEELPPINSIDFIDFCMCRCGFF